MELLLAQLEEDNWAKYSFNLKGTLISMHRIYNLSEPLVSFNLDGCCSREAINSFCAITRKVEIGEFLWILKIYLDTFQSG